MPDRTGDKMNFRAAPASVGRDGRPTTLNEAERSVEVIAATEDPTTVMDWERGLVDEVLLMSGAELPKSRQTVLLDSHSRYGTADIVGSFRDVRVQDGQLVGRAVFSTEAESVYRKVAEGHLTDFSVGYRVIESQFVPDGEVQKISGRNYTGPVKIATRWRVKELSAVAIGADENAKTRMDSTFDKNQNSQIQEESTMPKEKTVEEIRKEEIDRIGNITTMCRQFGLSQEMESQWLQSGASMESVRAAVLDIVAARLPEGIGYRGPIEGNESHPATVVHDAVDKRVDAQVEGLCLRAGLPVENPGAGREYAHFSFLDHAKECLRANGRRVNGSPDQVFRAALESRAMVTGDLPYILGNFANKTALIGYTETMSPIVSIFREIPAKDFKTNYMVALSESQDLEEVPEKGDYQYNEFSEHRESFALSTYGKIFAITRQALINDDLGMMAQIARSHGAAASRKVRDVCLSVLTGNGTMSDGYALFSTEHSNFVSSGNGAPPGDATLKAAYKSMKLQRGPAGVSVLGIIPKYLVVPVSIEVDAWQLLESTGDLTVEKNAGVRNPWYQKLTLIPEAALDGFLETGWYLAADQNRSDTLVLSFLNGKNSPDMFTKDGWTVDGTEFKVRIDVAGAAAAHQGLYYNYGA